MSENMGMETAVYQNPSIEKRSHILIVDDEPEITESLSDFLVKKADFLVSSARDGQEAIDFLRASISSAAPDVDLVLLDMRMPNLSGLDVLNWIREHPTLQYTRVVLLTAAAGSSEKVEALTAGADDYITKPYRPQELLARVNTILRTQQLEKQLQNQSQQLAALNRIGQTVAATLEASKVMATAVAGIEHLLHIELAGVLMVEGGTRLRYQNLHGQGGALPVTAVPSIPVGEGLLGTAFQEQTAVILNQPSSDDRFQAEIDAPPNFQVHSLIAAPLVVRGRPVGLINAFNKRNGRFNEVDLDLFASLASAMSAAVENAWLFTRIRQRQQEILESRNTLQALIDGIPHPIYTINDNWQLIGINKSKADELDTVPEHLVNKVCYEAFFNRSQPCDHCLAGQTLAHKNAQRWTINWKGEDHLPREWVVNAYPIPSRRASSARGVILWQDRTEERRLESSLLQAGKLAAIGQLAAGVAHEINNPLTAINANAEMLKMFIPKEDENYEAVDLIALAGERATKVVRGLLDFARQEHYNLTTGDINQSIQQTLDLVRYQLNMADAEVIQNMAENLPPVVASWEHLKSVWLNLIVNARDAVVQLPHKGQIRISTQLAHEQEHVQIIIRDNGKGMSEAELVHIFEPFYTTKDPGKGTGLGLATSHRIIEQHGGEINVVSTPNEGATFIIRLPINGNKPSQT